MRLIDADTFIEEARKRIDMQDMYLPVHIKELVLDEMTTVDAVPVRHGRWTADEALYTHGMAVCSCCKTEYYIDDLYMVGNDAQGELPNYCPNCGARMKDE